MHARLKLALALSCVGLGACAGMGGKSEQSLAEARTTEATPAAVTFAQADLDGDAKISRREFDIWLRRSADAGSAQAAAGGTSAGDAFYAADTNLNGVLTLDEWQAMASTAAAPRSARTSAATGR